MHFSQQTGGNIGKDPQTIVGVNIRYPETYEDERGELCEAWLPEWALHPDATATVVYVTIRPGQTRGWVVHHRQDDRVFVGSGSAKIVLYDAREGSASEGCVNELYLGSERRGVFTARRTSYLSICRTARTIGRTRISRGCRWIPRPFPIAGVGSDDVIR